MTGLREAPEPVMYTNGSPVSRRFVGGGASGVLNSCGIAAAVAPHARGARVSLRQLFYEYKTPYYKKAIPTHTARTRKG